ncbi:MAG: tRNA 2-thiouridine(34) synthase MnmA [Clostridiales Family XIII bacterium]|jgi:tRNA-specific 2-thiouridylase|nr:tRNA 2-thiouridine(34) synthase MnmA [Clostridiales Family XIII bacterium]
MKGRAMIAMSGGVDSSVAALLMRDAGYACVGVTMKLFANEDVGENADRPCCSLADAGDAARVAAGLGLPHYVFDFTEDFRREVVERFISSYEGGETPNPCIDCNDFLKFGKLLSRARAMEFDVLATGHYARICFDGERERWLLKRAADTEKDQTYFLYTMTQEQLAHTSFPLGGLVKAETRAIAAKAGFVNAKKAESQDICFVRSGDYAGFAEAYAGRVSPPGDFVDEAGRVLGRHKGIIRYTIGQRRGLGMAFGRPMYVCGIRAETNEVVLADEAAVFAKGIELRDVNLIAVSRIDRPLRADVMIRYGARPAAATAAPAGEGRLRIEFDEPVRAPAKGQAAVLYEGDVVIGGGRIDGIG